MDKQKNILSTGFSVELYTRPSTETNLVADHSHKFHEFYFLLEGKAKYWINNEIINVNANQVAYVKKGYMHKATYDYGSTSKRMSIWFTTEFVGEEYLSILGALDKKKIISASVEYQEQINHLLWRIRKEYEEQKEQYLLQCKNLLRELIIVLSRQQVPLPSEELTPNEAIIQNAAQYISAHLDEDLSLKGLASMYAMSGSHFSRTFTRCTGVGVSKYIKITRLRKAEKLLVQNKYSIAEIAMKCGFNNSNYFISEFKKYKGVTPFQYATKNMEA